MCRWAMMAVDVVWCPWVFICFLLHNTEQIQCMDQAWGGSASLCFSIRSMLSLAHCLFLFGWSTREILHLLNLTWSWLGALWTQTETVLEEGSVMTSWIIWCFVFYSLLLCSNAVCVLYFWVLCILKAHPGTATGNELWIYKCCGVWCQLMLHTCF